ncbi:hypothetical protein AMECASPLE_019109 [Ameca splendens]|uniref:Uncharacterized protein n=1 Tax=Ameca splendens TaxID=208324 RepID=A0ABV1A038_9TELE
MAQAQVSRSSTSAYNKDFLQHNISVVMSLGFAAILISRKHTVHYWDTRACMNLIVFGKKKKNLNLYCMLNLY